jgi:outer membrane protein assembly factor BamB
MTMRTKWMIGAAAATVAALGAWAAQSNAVTPTDWLGFMHSSGHDSYNQADPSITPSNVSQLTAEWTWHGDAATMPGQPGPSLFASPTVAGGSIYIGANNGYFYKLSEATGAVQRKVFIGYRPALTCYARGFIATATVAPDPANGESTVYVAAPNGYLYALRASDLTTKWRSVIDIPSSTVNDYFQWSSPTVANGKIYVGSASHCDKPLTRGAVVGYDQATGAEFARFYTVPSDRLGGGVWSSVAVDLQGNVYASTGTQPKDTTNRYDSVSIVKLDGNTLHKLGSFTVPDSELGGDGDFGGSPTIFGSHVGACNKNGIYYALDRATMTLDWKVRMGAKASGSTAAQCSAAAVWDGAALYFAGDATTIGGVGYAGSVRRINPDTGAFVWQRGLPNSVLGTPTLSGGGVLAVGTFVASQPPNAVYLINAANGQLLRTLNTGGRTFAQSVFANGYVFTANVGKGLTAYTLP